MSGSKHDEPAKPKGGDAGEQDEAVEILPVKKQSFSQQLLIWFLVIMVGVLFGMGPAVMILRGPGPETIGTVSQTEAIEYRNTISRLRSLLGQAGPGELPWQAVAREIYTARKAEAEGLMPKGKVLDELVAEFLQQPLGTGQTVGQRLSEYEQSDRGVQAHELRKLLQYQNAIANLQQRHLLVPVVPSSVAKQLKALEGDKVELASVTLSTAALLDEFREQAAGDQATLQTLYHELKDRWFQIPAAAELTVFAADPERIAPAVIVSDEAVAQAYETMKTRRPDWRLPDEEPAAGEDQTEDKDQAEAETPAAPRYKPLEEVREEILAELRQEQAQELAKELYDAFNTEVRRLMIELALEETKDLPRADLIEVAKATTIGPETHPEQLSAPVGITLSEQVEVTESQDGAEVQLPGYGSVRLARDVFAQDTPIGTLDEPIPDRDGLGLLLRVEGHRPSSYRPLEEVREQVVDYHAGRLAYPALLERAQEIAETAGAMGADALRTHFAPQEVQDRWQASVSTETVGAMAEYQAPRPSVEGVPGQSWPVIAIASQDRPLRVVSAPGRGESLQEALPSVRLVQVTGYIPAGDEYRGFARDPRSQFGFRPKQDEDWVAEYRRALEGHLAMRFNETITQSMLER